MSKDKIKKMFEALSAIEQNQLLFELTNFKKEIEIDTEKISTFASKHQKEYGKDITFTVSKSQDNNFISVVLHTIFGNFTGIGRNQKIAKINAVGLANETWND